MIAVDPQQAALVGFAFLCGLVIGALVTALWRGSGERFARRMLQAGEAQRQADTEAMLDGVKLAFGDITLDTFQRLAERLGEQTRSVLAGERQLHGQELRAERSELEARLRTVLDQIERMRGLVLELERDREGKFGRLEAELKQAGERAASLAETTGRLARTLAGTRQRGQWGERLAEDVLRLAGLVENVSFRRQAAGADGRRPDFTILVPDGRVLHMDVKFPFDNYQRSLEAADRESRGRYEAAFLRDVRAKVAEIVERGYVAPEAGTLDIALLFIPNEQVFEAVGRLAPPLIDDALRRGVVLVSPLTLVAVLAIVRRAATTYRLSRATREIGEAAAAFRSAWAGYCAESDAVARRLEDAMAGIRALAGTRRARLERAVGRLEALADGEQPDPAEASGPVGREDQPEGCETADTGFAGAPAANPPSRLGASGLSTE